MLAPLRHPHLHLSAGTRDRPLPHRSDDQPPLIVLRQRTQLRLLGLAAFFALPLLISQAMGWGRRATLSGVTRSACDRFLHLNPGWNTAEGLRQQLDEDTLTLPASLNSVFSDAVTTVADHARQAPSGILRLHAVPRIIASTPDDSAMAGSFMRLDTHLEHSPDQSAALYLDLPWPQEHAQVIHLKTPCGDAQQLFTLDLTAWNHGRLHIVSLQNQTVIGDQVLDLDRPQ